jgi:hypothetical protein
MSPQSGRFHQEDVAVTVRSRFWLAAALGVWMAQPLMAGEPARLGMAPGALTNPRPGNSANQQLADTIADHLRQSGNLRHYHVDIAFRNGVAELTGSVADQPQREEVLRIVQAVPGVERLRDRLTLAGQGPISRAQATEHSSQEVAPLPKQVQQGNGHNGNGGPVEPSPIFHASPVPHDLNPPKMPPYAWPTYAPYNNFSRVAYPTLYPYKSWPFIGPVYPFPKVPLGWRKVQLEWMDGHWWYSSTAHGHDWWRLRYW